MNAIPYLFLTQLKNRIREFFRKPANWVISIVFVGLMALVLFTGNLPTDGELRDINELYAIVTALLAAMFMMITFSGLKNGASLFQMADTHTLFTSPVSPRKILFYGLFRQLGTSLLVGLFLLFQYAWMHQLYGIGIGFLFIVLVYYGVSVFAGQMTALMLYSYSSDNPKRRRLFKIVLYAICAAAAAYLCYKAYLGQPNTLPALVAAANTRILSLFPVGGWLGASLRLFMGDTPLMGLIPLAVFLLFIGVVTWLMMRTNTDYYEDVLGATETAFNQREAQKEGRGIDMTPQHVKTGKTGLAGARGAAAISAKLRLEARRARKFIFEPMTLIFLIVTIVYAYFVRNLGIIPILFFTTYIQLFEVGNERWTRELQKPYVYLIPEPPFKKLLCLMASAFGTMALESVIQYGAIGALLQLDIATILCLIVARFGLGVLIMAGNVMYNRLLGGAKAKGVMMLVYMVMMLLLLVPPVAVVFPLGGVTLLGLSSTCVSLVGMAIVALLEALLVLFLCRNTLANSEVL